MTDFLWPLCRITLLTTCLWMALVSLLLADNIQNREAFIPSPNSCATHIFKYEKQHGIPSGLLHAISKAESGRKDDTGRIVPWPWTINAQGQGYFFPTKQAAIAAVQAMQAKGVESIDVGCMQINLYYHPHAFKTLDDAFEPSKNVAYAAHFLTSLKKDHSSWYRAIAHYHSANPIHHIPYQKNILAIWKRDNKAGAVALASGVFSQQRSLPTMNHIHRLSSGKTLRVTRGNSTLSANRSGVYRSLNHGSTSRIRRLKL